MIQSYLSSEGFVGSDLSQRVDELMQLATNRLVLLSQQIEGTISFDVRSLQEFMAAAAITSGDQAEMDRRLKHIAGHSHWRHVFQIAASRCFADDSFHYRRSIITQITREMDTTEPDMVSRNGARLALDLLADGVAFDHPNFRRPLLQHALEQLDLGTHVLDDRLARTCDESVADLVRDEVSRRILEGTPPNAVCAWKLLFQISQLGQRWADDLIIKLWPQDRSINVDVWDEISIPLGNQRVADHLATALAKAGPTLGITLYGFARRISARPKRDDEIDYTRFRAMNFLEMPESKSARISCRLLQTEFKKGCEIGFIPIGNPFGRFNGGDFVDESWDSFRAVERFNQSPNKNSLAACLDSFCQTNIWFARGVVRMLPWPISTLLTEATGTDHLRLLSSEAKSGARGDLEDWLEAERRWEKVGITEDDFCAATEDAWFRADINYRGAPAWIDAFNRPISPSLGLIRRLDAIAHGLKNKKLAAALFDTVTTFTAFGMRHETLSEADTEFVLDKLLSSRIKYRHSAIELAVGMQDKMWRVPTIANKLGKLLSTIDGFEVQHPVIRDRILDALESHPNCLDMLYPAAVALSEDGGGRTKLEEIFSESVRDHIVF